LSAKTGDTFSLLQYVLYSRKFTKCVILAEVTSQASVPCYSGNKNRSVNKTSSVKHHNAKPGKH